MSGAPDLLAAHVREGEVRSPATPCGLADAKRLLNELAPAARLHKLNAS